jgi:hypothetical protein
LKRDRLPALNLILQRALEDIDDLFAGMLVFWGDCTRVEAYPDLDDFTSVNAEIMPL